jgi:hypothetical protein
MFSSFRINNLRSKNEKPVLVFSCALQPRAMLSTAYSRSVSESGEVLALHGCKASSPTSDNSTTINSIRADRDYLDGSGVLPLRGPWWCGHPLQRQLDPRLSSRGSRPVLVAPAQELMQYQGDFVGMRCAPGNNPFELDGIVGDGADFHQLGFDDLQVSHGNSSMAHVGAWKPVRWAGSWMLLRRGLSEPSETDPLLNG